MEEENEVCQFIAGLFDQYDDLDDEGFDEDVALGLAVPKNWRHNDKRCR